LVADGGSVIFADESYMKDEEDPPARVGEVDILLSTNGVGGITEYAEVMRQRLIDEAGIGVSIAMRRGQVTARDVVVQFENGLPRAETLINDALDLADLGHRVYFDVHAAFSDFGLWNSYLPQLERKTRMLYRANEVAEADGVEEFTLMPHLSYRNVPPLPPSPRAEIKLGTFGFASRGKRYEDLIMAARRMWVPIKLLLSVDTEISERVADDMRKYIAELKRNSCDRVEIRDGFFSYEEIKQGLIDCSHLIFTTRDALSNSGSMQLAKRLNKPILSLKTFQAQQAQVHEFESLTDRCTEIYGQLFSTARMAKQALFERPDLSAQLLLGLLDEESRSVIVGLGKRALLDFYRAVTARRTAISRQFIETHNELSRDEDGLLYLLQALRYPEVGEVRPISPAVARRRSRRAVEHRSR
jgi:hypothetical protein